MHARVRFERMHRARGGGLPSACCYLERAPVRTQTRELVDLATVGDLEIANDAVLYMLLKKDGGDSWEVRDRRDAPSRPSTCVPAPCER